MHRVPAQRVSVIVRARDEADSIGHCLELVRAQDRPAEIIVVDHASRDATAAIARHHGATVISIAPSAFSFGAALNRGAEHANHEILVALSAHAFPLDRHWLARLADALDDPSVACACGERYTPDGGLLTHPLRIDYDATARRPDYGYSNAAGAFRAELWRTRPFRQDLPACEDKEWAAHWAEHGYVTVLDPALAVEHDHTHDPVSAIYRRARREAIGMAMLRPGPAGPGEERKLPSEWWSDTRFYASPWRARLSPRRAARLLGAYAGGRGLTRPPERE